MNKLLITMIVGLVLLSGVVLAVQPTQQYNKILLSPYYYSAIAKNTYAYFNLSFNPPDGLGEIKTAILNFQTYITSSPQDIILTINGSSCNTPTFTGTASGFAVATFDCSNIIKSKGNYSIRITSIKDIGSTAGWSDITYMNNPQGSADIFGTEYYEGDDATIFLLLKDSGGQPVTNATCTIDIYYPNIANLTHPEWINNGLMMYKEEGLYYYDFTVPLTTGLYMVNAQCTYVTQNNYFYTLAKGVGPTRVVTTGTYTGDSFVLNDYQEWLYTQCDSATSGGVKACDAYNEWNVSTSSLGNVTQLYVQYLGENSGGGTLTMYWWNWNTSAWVALPNTLTFKSTAAGGVPSGVDEYLSNSVPLTAISSSGMVRIRTYTTAGSTFKQFNNWLALRTSQYATTTQDLKGSGEVHVSSLPPGTNRFFKVLTCEGFIDGRCGEFTNDGEFDLEEGEIEDFINISATSTKSNIQISYNTPFSVDCTALYWIKEYNGTAWVDFTDYTVYSQPAYENCIVILNKNIVSGTEYQFWLKMDNYMKWEVDWTKKMGDSVNSSVNYLCNNRNFTYINPITDSTPTTTDPITDYCYQFYDDQYWLNNYYDNSQSVSLAGEYASYVQEMRYYRGVLMDRYTFLVLGNNTNLMSDYYANKVWNHSVRNLTYYPSQLDLTNYTMLANYVWNATNRNLTYYPIQVDLTNYSWISQGVWTYVDRNLTYFPPQVDLTNYSRINGEVAIAVWNYTTRNLTFFPTQQDLTNYSQISYDVWSYVSRTLTAPPENLSAISIAVWNYTTRELTFYPAQVDMTNYSRISNLTASEVWTYVDRNLTYYEPTDTNAVAVAVWNYTARNLTYFPEQADLTNYSRISNLTAGEVWEYSTRNLTYYAPATLDYETMQLYVWNATSRNLTYYPPQVDLTNYTLITENVWTYVTRTLTADPSNITAISNAVWSATDRNLTYYPSQTDMTNYSLIGVYVWNETTRDLTYYPAQVDMTNYTLISQDVWAYVTRTLTSSPENTTAIANAVWSASDRNLTYYPVQSDMTNYSLIGLYVWNETTRNLTYFPPQVDMTNYTLIDGGVSTAVWVYGSRNLTYFPEQVDLTNYTLINSGVASAVWVYGNRNLTYFPEQVDMTNYSRVSNLTAVEVWTYTDRNLTYYAPASIDTNSIALAVWNSTTRNFTFYPAQEDLTNYTLINEGVWAYVSRTLTSAPENLSAISYAVWNATTRDLTFYPAQVDMTNYSKVSNMTPGDVWTYIDRNLTFYPAQVDMTNYTLAAQNVWTYAVRDLTYYQVNNISASDIWTYLNRTLTDDVPGMVWTYANRTLTYYQVNNLTAIDVWDYANRNLTYYPDVTNYTLVAETVWAYNTTTSPTIVQIADAMWNFTGRYINGILG
jgi:hypothetical protein